MKKTHQWGLLGVALGFVLAKGYLAGIGGKVGL